MTRSLLKLIAAIGAGLATVWFIVGLAVLALILLSLNGCVLSPDQKTVVREHEAPANCMEREDSTTFVDSGEVWHYSCRVDPGEPPPTRSAQTSPCLDGGTWTGTACEYDDPKPSEP